MRSSLFGIWFKNTVERNCTDHSPRRCLQGHMKASWTRELDLAVQCVVRESATSLVGPLDSLRIANSYPGHTCGLVNSCHGPSQLFQGLVVGRRPSTNTIRPGSDETSPRHQLGTCLPCSSVDYVAASDVTSKKHLLAKLVTLHFVWPCVVLIRSPFLSLVPLICSPVP